MKQKTYTFMFRGGPITVRAFNQTEAIILAQAEAIQRGWDYTICSFCLALYRFSFQSMVRNR